MLWGRVCWDGFVSTNLSIFCVSFPSFFSAFLFVTLLSGFDFVAGDALGTSGRHKQTASCALLDLHPYPSNIISV